MSDAITHEQLLPPIGPPEVTVLINGVPAGSYVVLLPAPGGSRMFGSDDIVPAHIAHSFRAIADIILADAEPCGCGDHDGEDGR